MAGKDGHKKHRDLAEGRRTGEGKSPHNETLDDVEDVLIWRMVDHNHAGGGDGEGLKRELLDVSPWH